MTLSPYQGDRVTECKEIPYPASCDDSDSLKINLQADPRHGRPHSISIRCNVAVHSHACRARNHVNP